MVTTKSSGETASASGIGVASRRFAAGRLTRRKATSGSFGVAIQRIESIANSRLALPIELLEEVDLRRLRPAVDAERGTRNRLACRVQIRARRAGW